MTVYLFDMDGTLTPPRLPMTEDFADTFVPWLAHHKAFIATGSDFAKVMEQLPDSVINAFSGIYCAMGNQLRQGHEIVYQKDFKLSDDLREDLERFRAISKYPGPFFDTKNGWGWSIFPYLVVIVHMRSAIVTRFGTEKMVSV